MRILLLTPQLPYPPHQGTSLRNYHIIRGLAQNHEVTLLSFVEQGQATDEETLRPLHSLCHHIDMVPAPQRTTFTRLQQLLTSRRPDMAQRLYTPLFELRLRHLLRQNQFDVVQVEGIELARYMSTVKATSPDSRLIFDNHNAETELQRRNLETDRAIPRRWPAALYSWLQVGRLARFERWALETAAATAAVSDADRIHLQQLAPNASITTIPNCIDVAAYTPADDEPTIPFDLVFSGKMDYRPNVDAVLWFAQAVWPQIKAERPETTWAVVGQKPHDRLAVLGEMEGVTVTGWVESIRPYLLGTSLFIMPFRIGSGTRLKLIEAMAAAKAIVSTAVGAEGFPVTHQKELWLAQGAEEMATAILTLLDDPQTKTRLGQQARQFAQQYDWRVVIPLFEELFEK
ncbi:MAG: glycosyltransferase [Chloroflexota bacterium]